MNERLLLWGDTDRDYIACWSNWMLETSILFLSWEDGLFEKINGGELICLNDGEKSWSASHRKRIV